jgi:GGDEF domain-containing protein
MHRNMARQPLERGRPRPVADAPLEPLADGELVAKRWLIELIAAVPLHAAGELPAAEMARRGPVVCAALIAALSSDGALERLKHHGETAADAVGAQTAPDMVAAVEALRGAAWAEIDDELRAGDSDLRTGLADRLAHCCSALLESAFETAAASPVLDLDGDGDGDGNGQPRPLARRRPIVPVDGSLKIDSGPEGEPWRPAVEKRLKRYESDKVAFGLLALEVDDLERLTATGDAAEEAIELAERAVSATLRPGDVLVRERAGRYWLAAPETDELAARILAEQLATAVSEAAQHHGAPLTMSIGIAVCPQHGTDAAELAAYADEAVFAARAAGVRLA